MSLIKDLKTNPEHIFNLVEAIELFVPEKKSKYTNLLLRLMKSTPQIDEHVDELTQHFVKSFPFINEEDLKKMKPLQIMILFVFVDKFFNSGDLDNFGKFCQYNELGYIELNDLSRYTNIDEIVKQVNIAEVKVQSKELEKEIEKVYEDDNWLMIRPLSYIASKKYGSNTKWCTTSESNPEYFLKYTTRGVLIYSMNKKTGYKVASFYSLDKKEPEFSFWNQKDQKIDSMESELPVELVNVIKNVFIDKNAQTNRELMTDELINKEHQVLKKYMNESSINQIINASVSARRSVENGTQRKTSLTSGLSNRIANALQRENESQTDDNVNGVLNAPPPLPIFEGANVTMLDSGYLTQELEMGEDEVSDLWEDEVSDMEENEASDMVENQDRRSVTAYDEPAYDEPVAEHDTESSDFIGKFFR